MQKLLGLFLLFSVLALGGIDVVKNAQADSPTKHYYDDGISPEHQNRENRQKVDGSPEFFNSTFPRKDFYPDYYKLYDYKPSGLFLGELDDRIRTEVQNDPYWKNVSFINPSYPGHFGDPLGYYDEHSWFVFRVLTRHSGQTNMFFGYKADEDARIALFNLAKANPTNVYIVSASFAPDNCTPHSSTITNKLYDLSLLSNVRMNFGAANKSCELNAGNTYSFMPNVVSVSSLNSSQTAIASFSNVILWNSVENRRVQTIFTPGESLPILDSKYQATYISGTSFSTPQKSSLDVLMEKLRLKLAEDFQTSFEITSQSQFFDLQIASSDQITDTTRFPGQTIVANVLNGVDALLGYEAFLTQKPVCHPKYSTLVANSPFDLGCGFPTSTHAQISIAGCAVTLTQAKELVAEYSVTCANVGTLTVMADNVAVGSFEVVSFQEARSLLPELKVEWILDSGETTYSQNSNESTFSGKFRVKVYNGTAITQSVTYNTEKSNLWLNCSNVNFSCELSFAINPTTNSPDIRIPDSVKQVNWTATGNDYLIPPGVGFEMFYIAKIQPLQTGTSSFSVSQYPYEGVYFCQFCSPSVDFGATQPTATVTVPVATATPTINETPTPTVTTPVSNETATPTATPTATVLPGAARRVYLPLVMKRN